MLMTGSILPGQRTRQTKQSRVLADQALQFFQAGSQSDCILSQAA
jgi:hypothetical protein